MGSPTATHVSPDCTTRPLEQRAAITAHARTASRTARSASMVAVGSYPSPTTRARPAGVHASTTAMRFSVRVPVLSVHTKVVDPSVSTDSSRRTSACRCAMRCAPIASDKVTVGSRPSGTNATVTPIANRNPSRADVPMRSASTKNTTPTPTAMNAIVRTTRASSRASGVGGRSLPWVIDAIPASRVAAPVATTEARASPSTTNVPAKSVASASTRTVLLSPVSIELSTSSAWASTTRRSALTRSPATHRTTSSTTSPAASMSRGSPSRNTVTRRGRRSRSFSAARSARCSWTKAKTPLSTTTAKTAIPSCTRPATIASVPATHSISAKKCRS